MRYRVASLFLAHCGVARMRAAPWVVLLGALAVAHEGAPAVGDTLSGRIQRVLSAERSPYVVVGDITIPQGRTIIIEPGTVLLFNSFTSLKVQGTLLARGSAEKPIVFTSINDRAYNPLAPLDAAPYDWNGIQIVEGGMGTTLSYCTISYSVFGIMSLTRFVRIGPALFAHNGRADLSIEGVDYDVGQTPFEYAPSLSEVGSAGIPLTLLRDPLATRRAIARSTGIAAAATGVTIGILSTLRFRDAMRTFHTLSTNSDENLAAHTAADWQQARSRARLTRAALIAGYLLGGAGGVVAGWSFSF